MSEANPDLISMQEVCGEIRRITGQIPPVNAYNRLKQATYDGRLETVKIGGLRYVPRHQLQAATEELGMTFPKSKLRSVK